MNISDIPTLYINLEKRKDRNENALRELNKLGLNNITRFNAIENSNGAIGCSLSHIKCLELAIEQNYDDVLICEDDISILNSDVFLTNINKFLNSNVDWDVVLVAGNNTLPFKPINDYCIQVYNCLTTTGYIVKKHYYSNLLRNYKEGLLHLIKNPYDKQHYAIDKYWLKLQLLDKWYLIIPPTITQKDGYSDIEKRNISYSNFMLNYIKVIKK